MKSGIPVISIDTKKKEMIGNFKRQGLVYCSSSPKAYDHDFTTFSSGTIVPHGIYDIANNTDLKRLYPNAVTLVILCDGDGYNSCRHHIVKQDLMNLADRIGLKILVLHYPPCCSKFNPIEHWLFSQITRSWANPFCLRFKMLAKELPKPLQRPD